MERKFVEMESSLEKKLSDSMSKVCEAKISQVNKKNFAKKSRKSQTL